MNIKQELENLVAKCKQEGDNYNICLANEILILYSYLAGRRTERNEPSRKIINGRKVDLPEGSHTLTFRGQIDNPKPDPEEPFYTSFNL